MKTSYINLILMNQNEQAERHNKKMMADNLPEKQKPKADANLFFTLAFMEEKDLKNICIKSGLIL